MFWIDQFKENLQKLLAGESPNGSSRNINSRENRTAYRRWVDHQVYLNWTPGIFKAYHFRKCSIAAGFRLHLIEEPNHRGVLLYYHPDIGRENFRFLFELIKDRSLALPYHLYLSDERVITHERYTETINKHYLKPLVADAPDGRVCDQQYGNIIIDLISINRQPGYIRFYVNSFQSPLFSKPLPFEALMDRIFNEETP